MMHLLLLNVVDRRSFLDAIVVVGAGAGAFFVFISCRFPNFFPEHFGELVTFTEFQLKLKVLRALKSVRTLIFFRALR